MAGKRKNGEGSYGEKTIKGVKYKYYRDVDGKYIYSRTQKELTEKIKKKREKQKEEDILNSNPNGKLTIGEYADSWLKSKRTTIKPKTYDGYEFNISIIKSPDFMFGSMQIVKIQKKQVQDFLDEMAGKYARNTIIKTRTLLNQIFDEAVENNIILKNPVTKTKVPLEENVKKNTREIIFLEKDDIEKFKKEALAVNGDGLHKPIGKHGTPMYGVCGKMAVFILNTGLRAGEAIDLRWENVNLDKKIINVKKAATYIKNRNAESNKKYTLESGTPKSIKSIRTVPLSDEAIDIIKSCENNHSEFVFATRNGTRVLHSNLDKTINRILQRANCNVQHCGAHALRHTFASQLLANDVEISIVSKLLGHSKISTTYDKYIHVLKNKDVDAINTINTINNMNQKS